jgi:hypothetical protein
MSPPDSFWARRRAGVRAEAEAKAAAEEAAIDARHQQALAEKSDAEILAELDLPDPETLTQGDDFAAFMARAVPEHLRNRALRKLWRSNPVLACVDGLNDYDDDYLTGSYGNAPLKTSYQVGKGLLAHVLEMAQEAGPDADDDARLDKTDISEEDERHEDVVAPGETSAPGLAADIQTDPQDIGDVRPRRMVFRFDRNTA